MRHSVVIAAVLVTVMTGHAQASHDADFENRIRPLLVKSCLPCHGTKKQSGSLRLDSREMMLRGGESGPALVLGQPEKSLLIQAVRHQGNVQMPPRQKLDGQQIADLAKWIERGAPWPAEPQAAVSVRTGPITPQERSFWSFQHVRKPLPPKVHDASWPRNDIDRFILRSLEDRNLRPASDTDKRTLLRRVTVDLTGLPPTPEEVHAFLADTSAEAFAKVVDRLLASPRYGERWGRHWLDVVRYADTAGETADYPAPLAYRYRDYVINAFNADKPFDEFIREQIAGDILAAQGPREKYADRVVATGFIAISRRFGFDPENYFHLTIQDTIDTVGQAFLGLSLGCARCHDHKFDPVLRDDYYALYGIFDSTRYSIPGSESKRMPADLVPLVPPDAAEKKLALAKSNPAGEVIEVAYAVAEGKPHDVRIHKRGEPRDLGSVAPRRFLSVLGGDPLPANAGSGRLALAEWIARPENPLTRRVMVNRIWQHHFGAGLVATPNDFGSRGQRPRHPELLDYLAERFLEEGWSIKAMHRLIVLSRTYQVSSRADEALVSGDPGNVLFGRAPVRRLEAEAIRDSMLAVAGTLDLSMGGPHPFPPQKSWGFTQHAPFSAIYDHHRRSVYLMTPRLKRHPFLALFDGADSNASTPRRETTIVPTQALYLMNAPFVHQQAEAFADRILKQASDRPSRVRAMFEGALARPPAAEEVESVDRFLDDYTARVTSPALESREREAFAALARTMFARNEFLYVR